MSETKDDLDSMEVSIPEESKPLMNIKGIGPKTVQKLIDIGVNTPAHLVAMPFQDLAALLQINKKAAREICNDAIDKFLPDTVHAKSLDDIIIHQKDIVKRIPTGVTRFDQAMDGGLPTEAITIFKGEYESGKSQFCYQLAVNCLKYHKRHVVWIETESGTFVGTRLLEVAKATGVKVNGSSDMTIVTSDEASRPQLLYNAYEMVSRIVKNKNVDVGLLIIDSFSAPFKAEYGPRERLPARSQDETKHLGWLNEFAKNNNCAIVLTAQIMGLPDTSLSLAEKAKSGHNKKMQGGTTVQHGGTYLISLEQKSKIQYEGIIFGSPNVPRTAFRFKLTKQGVRDI